MQPIVSVLMITYNHVNFIKEAVDGVLMQETNFKYELIIGDDCSLDSTGHIIENIIKNHTKGKLINYKRHKNNLGMQSNYISTFNRCSGNYIAVCEGDDYWTDPEKLQKQVDFLEKNSDFSICFHNTKILYEDEPSKINFSNPDNQKEISSFDDLAKGEYIYTATCMFKSSNFKIYPKKYTKYSNNYTTDLHNAQFGKIKYINEVMSVYRVSKSGVWSMVERDVTLLNQLPTYKFYIKYFGEKNSHHFYLHVSNMLQELLEIKNRKNDFKNYWKYYFDFFFRSILNIHQIKNIIRYGITPFKIKIQNFLKKESRLKSLV